MKPYYQDDYATIYHGDCEEIIPTLPKPDIVATDPPYGISDAPMMGTKNRRGKPNTWHLPSYWDKELPLKVFGILGALRIPLAIFGNWRQREKVHQAVDQPLKAEIVWAKNCHTSPPCPLARRDERIWIFSHRPFKGRTFETSVWDSPVIPTWKRKEHKNEKPILLLQRLIRWLPEGLILDPYMGSGTTVRAAKDLEQKSIGIEIEESYCEIAAIRLGA